MLKLSVSKLNAVNLYRQNDWFSFAMLEQTMTNKFSPSIKADIGTDFHSIIENKTSKVVNDDYYIGDKSGYRFKKSEFQEKVFSNIEYNEYDMFEVDNFKIYDAIEPVKITARVDILSVNKIIDIKTMSDNTLTIDKYESYHNSLQWKIYLDMFKYDLFQYKIWSVKIHDKIKYIGINDAYEIEFAPCYNMERDIIQTINDAIGLIKEHNWEQFNSIKNVA